MPLVSGSRLRLLACAASLALTGVTFAEMPKSPTLIVTLVVDQYSADVFNEYRPLYQAGLKRLTSGVVFPRGHQGHASTETCPGHSTILTGYRPAHTGIIANEWQTPKQAYKTKGGTTFEVYCVKDPATQAVTTGFLKVKTLGDRMKQHDPQSKVVAVAGKDRAATMLAGGNADMTLWWDADDSKFKTYANGRTPAKLADINSRVAMSIQANTPVDMHASCRARARNIKVTESLSVGTETTEVGRNAWRASAAFDAAVLDAALTVLDEEKLGADSHVDLLAISFSATDYVGHRYGSGGVEMCTQQLRLDAIVGQLLDRLDHTGVSYVVALTADHGGLDLVERNQQQGVSEAKRLESELYPQAVGKYVAEKLGLDGQVLLGTLFASDIYFSADIPKSKRAKAIALAKERYLSFDKSVASVFTWEEINAAPKPAGPVDEWTLLERAKASFDPERSGSLVVMVKPFVTPLTTESKNYLAGHGTPWGYDRRVPILFWWQGVEGFDQPKAVETVDIMPTLAALIGLNITDEIDGRALDLERATR